MRKMFILYLLQSAALLAILFSLPTNALADADDVLIRTEIRTSYFDPELQLSGVRVEVKNREVVLHGTAPNTAARNKAEQIAYSAAGVTKVTNKIEVLGPSTTSETNVDVPAIIGSRIVSSVVGSVIVFVLAAGLFLILSRRQRKDDKQYRKQLTGGADGKTYYNLAGFMKSLRRRERAGNE